VESYFYAEKLLKSTESLVSHNRFPPTLEIFLPGYLVSDLGIKFHTEVMNVPMQLQIRVLNLPTRGK
jgi:hypothetical protein